MWDTYLLSALVTFIAVGLKGFQHKNVIGGHLRLMVTTSYLMALFDVLAVSFVVEHGWTIAFSAGTGAALGMLASVTAHDRWVKPREKPDRPL